MKAQVLCAVILLAQAGLVWGAPPKRKPKVYKSLQDICVEKQITNSLECARAIEKHQARKVPEMVQRKGPLLLLKLKKGQKTLSDGAADSASGVHYSYRRYLKDIDYYLLHVQYYEGQRYALVSRASGKEFVIENLPVFSPNRKRLVAASHEGVDAYMPNGVYLWSVSPRELNQEFSYDAKGWGPSTPAWLDNDSIALERRPLDLTAEAPLVRLLLKRHKDQWVLYQELQQEVDPLEPLPTVSTPSAP